jgi:hypothetical protein
MEGSDVLVQPICFRQLEAQRHLRADLVDVLATSTGRPRGRDCDLVSWDVSRPDAREIERGVRMQKGA